MKIQFGHKREGNFRENFYTPLQKNFPEIDWIFPHDQDDTKVISEETLKQVDIFLAEVTDAATGLGIELGFAKAYGKRIICIHRPHSDLPRSLKYITNEVFEYTGDQDMIEKLKNIL